MHITRISDNEHRHTLLLRGLYLTVVNDSLCRIRHRHSPSLGYYRHSTTHLRVSFVFPPFRIIISSSTTCTQASRYNMWFLYHGSRKCSFGYIPESQALHSSSNTVEQLYLVCQLHLTLHICVLSGLCRDISPLNIL